MLQSGIQTASNLLAAGGCSDLDEITNLVSQMVALNSVGLVPDESPSQLSSGNIQALGAVSPWTNQSSISMGGVDIRLPANVIAALNNISTVPASCACLR